MAPKRPARSRRRRPRASARDARGRRRAQRLGQDDAPAHRRRHDRRRLRHGDTRWAHGAATAAALREAGGIPLRCLDRPVRAVHGRSAPRVLGAARVRPPRSAPPGDLVRAHALRARGRRVEAGRPHLHGPAPTAPARAHRRPRAVAPASGRAVEQPRRRGHRAREPDDRGVCAGRRLGAHVRSDRPRAHRPAGRTVRISSTTGD